MKELEKLSDPNMWKTSKVDIAICYEIYNMVDEILEKLNEHIGTLMEDAKEDHEMIDTNQQNS
jgi:hypothetical protein